MKEEFDILGEDHHTARAPAPTRASRSAASSGPGEPVSHDGRFYSFPHGHHVARRVRGARCRCGSAATPSPRFATGGANDGLIGTAYPVDDADAVLDRLDAALEAEGRRLGDDGFEVILGLYTANPADFRRFAERGVTGFLAAPAMLKGDRSGAPTATVDDRRRAIAAFGETVIAPLNA